MKKIFLIFYSLICFSAFGETFFINQKSFEFSDYKGVLIANCLNKCEAKKHLKKPFKINLKTMRSKQRFANSVGSDVCSLVYKGNSTLGLASNRDQRAFCVFKDDSLIEINSLSLYLKQKNLVKE